MRSRLPFVVTIFLLMLLLQAQASGQANAAVVGSRRDPVVKLSNGIVVKLSALILDNTSGARRVAVADGFDAMTSDRPYRRALSLEQAAMVLRQESGQQWGARLVEVFLEIIAYRFAPAPAPSSSSEHASIPERQELKLPV